MAIPILFLAFSGIEGKTTLLQPTQDVRSAIRSAQAGDTLLLSNGDYQSPGWLDNIKFTKPVVIKAVNKQLARFVKGNGLNINNCKGLIFDGLEITTLATTAGLIQVQGKSSYITIKNCHIHHAPLDADCIKINQSNNISVIGCHLHDPGTRAAGNGKQETLDYLDVDTGLISGCFFTGGTSRQYVNAKGLSSHIIVENCILKDHNGDQGDAAIVLGGYSDSWVFQNTPSGYECENMVVRNNIILNSRTGAFQISNVKNGYIYNNYIWNCTGYNGYRGLIYVSPGNGPGSNKGTLGLEIFNNIFASDLVVPLPSQIMQLSTTITSFTHGNNLFYFGGRPIPTGGVFNPNSETGAVFLNPTYPLASGTTYNTILNSMLPNTKGSWVDAGNSSAALKIPYPSVKKDIRFISRTSGIVDIGPFEFVSSPYLLKSTATIYNKNTITNSTEPEKKSRSSLIMFNGKKAKSKDQHPMSSSLYFIVKDKKAKAVSSIPKR
jgi:hypothetical protein